MSHAIFAPKRLDELSRCCGKKPTVYKQPHHRLVCLRCDRYYNPESGQQTNSYAFAPRPDGNFLYSRYDLANKHDRERLGEPLAVRVEE